MTLKIQIIIAISIIIGMFYIVNLIRKNRLELKYALSWLTVGIVVLVFDCFPKVMNILANWMGINSPVNMIFFLGFCFSLIIILTLTVALSITASSVKRLNQKIAMMDKTIKEMEKKLK